MRDRVVRDGAAVDGATAPGDLGGRVALVTGASRGIGAAIARRLSLAGARVAITARTEDRHPKLPGSLRETLAQLAGPGEAIAVPGDLTQASDRARIVDEVVRRLGPIDVLINNAARAFYEPAHQTSEKRLRLSWELNLMAPLDLVQRTVPAMRAQGAGWIVNISSTTSALPPGPPWNDFAATSGVYAASKAALERLTVGLAAELLEDGIAVNTLAPVAAVYTEAAARMGAMPKDESLIEPEEVIAEAALALSTCEARVLTGRMTLSGPLLEELGRTPQSLDR